MQFKVYSVSRSGGTYIQNFLGYCVSNSSKNVHFYDKVAFEKKFIEKSLKDGTNIFMIKRHPYAIFMSLILVGLNVTQECKGHKLILDNGSFASTVKSFKNELDNFINIVYNNFKDTMPILHYENFFNNNKHIEEFLKNNFNVNLNKTVLNEFYKTYGSTEKLLKFRKENRDEYLGHFQDSHVSVGKGDNLANLKLLSYELREKFKLIVDPYVKILGYEPYDLDKIEYNPII